nr:recombinase family protein [Rhabdobacter roseus]
MIGYARGSIRDQNLELQMDALAKAGCNIIFQEKASGVKTYRPDLEKMLSQLWKGDMLCIYKLDGSGRTATRQALKNLLELVAGFESRGVGLKSLTDSIDTTTPQGRLVLNIFGSPASSIAQQRDLIRERIKAGLEVVRGRKDGRKRGLSSEAQKKAMLAEVYYKDGKLGVDKIVKSVGVSKMTFDKHLHLR